MKKCVFEILPRQSGKTTELINLYSDLNGVSIIPSYFITMNSQMKREVIKRMQWIGAVFTPDEFINMVETKSYINPSCYNLFIDEYLFFDEQHQSRIYEISEDVVIDTVYIKTTSNKLHNNFMFNLVKKLKVISDEEITDFCFKSLNDSNRKKEFRYLYNNFLTDSKTKLYIKYNEWNKMMPKESFELSIGKFFNEEKYDY